MNLEELEEVMTKRDYENYMELCEEDHEKFTQEWFETEDLKQEILEKYGLDNPEDPYEIELRDDYDYDYDDYEN
ncbi:MULTISPECIES: hypothetical protein [Psychrilyobacter]|uniref:Phage protein n=1 Tax=Psychrilyobacter piezotolerans TaxID=2293438 RepID=A0ABX9KJL9_9FUSO|nr:MULTISPECIES: hypothetical protein [Psychrilyobacter]MCS5420630.1 hypothetical protein [Psychrilyobacter sp. S5]NDI77351.1 hypothetical protein [Psychrilyobacter piezotolerans]RDE63658.1 hypothetical protein DV867_04575 [Psychrilyobacter sp. S5]REI42002.1 hypothetical protein DYH56_04575 [Psychrilyobacter piezotolerans]